ncbi:MAG: glycosyltransferase family 1 protein [Eubacteriales bacterium]|nr:glycosyltransferase family 1 protein [Eubacteriales bacterium]
MRIGINGLVLKKENTGIGNYTINVINRMADLTDDELILFVMASGPIKHMINPKIKMVELYPRKISRYLKVLVEQLVLNRQIKKQNIDVLFCPAFTMPFIKIRKTVIVVHDMIYKLKIDGTSRHADWYRNFLFSSSIRKADKIITVSFATKNDLIRFFPNRGNIHVTYLDSTINQCTIKTPPNNIDKNDRFILMTGNVSPRKNISKAVEALNIIRDKTDVKLLLAGGVGKESQATLQAISSKNLKDRVIVAGYLTDEELAWCYENAQMLLFCSLYEGFGLPPLEAMQHNLPVIASNVTSIPEVVGNAALMVDPHSAEEIAEGIMELLTNENKRNDLIRKGQERIKQFSWEKTAEETLKILKN